MTGSSNFILFFFSEVGLTYSLDRETSEAELPLMFGVFEFREMFDSVITWGDLLFDWTEEVLLLEVASPSKFFNLEVKEELL
jgi:hypothetical protein